MTILCIFLQYRNPICPMVSEKMSDILLNQNVLLAYIHKIKNINIKFSGKNIDAFLE